MTQNIFVTPNFRFEALKLFGRVPFVLFLLLPSHAWALCNGGVTVTSSLVVSANCSGGNVKPLTLDTGGYLTINSAIQVFNDAGSGRNGDAVTILSTATSSTVINHGLIQTGSQIGLTNNGVLNNLTNFGYITSNVRRGVVNNGAASIITLTNVGTINGPYADITQNGTSTIQTINNLQGSSNGSGSLTIIGGLPSIYNIIINSTATYGQLNSLDGAATMAFNI